MIRRPPGSTRTATLLPYTTLFRCPKLAAYVCPTEYDAKLPAAVAFPPDDLRDTLGELAAQAGLKQLRIAETEKYAHVTFFFSGGREDVFDGEERILIPRPKVATYDLDRKSVV